MPTELIIAFVALIIGYLMGRMAAKPVIIDPFRQATTGDPGDPADVYEGPDEWDESMNKRDV